MNNRYITIPLVVRAVKMSRSLSCKEECAQTFETSVEFASFWFFVGELRGSYGEWLIYVNGTYRVLSDEQFYQQYNNFPSQ